jgi:hypothetical protein
MRARDITLLICYYLLISMYVYAAAAKLLTHRIFVLQLKRQPFPDIYSDILVWAIPSAEIIVSLMMISQVCKKWGLYLATALLVLFTAYIIAVKLNFYGVIPCSCAGVFSSFTWTQHLVFNLCFLSVALVGIYLERLRQL